MNSENGIFPRDKIRSLSTQDKGVLSFTERILTYTPGLHNKP